MSFKLNLFISAGFDTSSVNVVGRMGGEFLFVGDPGDIIAV